MDAFEAIIKMMCEKVKAGVDIEEVVDEYVDCATPELRQELIDGIRQIVGNDMIQKAMTT